VCVVCVCARYYSAAHKHIHRKKTTFDLARAARNFDQFGFRGD
jgi:hypothetical protein